MDIRCNSIIIFVKTIPKFTKMSSQESKIPNLINRRYVDGWSTRVQSVVATHIFIFIHLN